MKALLIIDVQVDYCPGGALPSPDGNNIIPVINVLMNRFPIVLASKDWHPEYSRHFNRWPVHCVQGSQGAKFHPDLDIVKIQQIFLKGTDDEDSGYSVFESTNYDLEEYLLNKNVKELYIAGLTVENSVKTTVFDAVNKGFETVVVKDAVGSIKKSVVDEENAWKEINEAGAIISDSMNVKFSVHI